MRRTLKLLHFLIAAIFTCIILLPVQAQNPNNLTYRTLEGTNINLSNYQGKVLIVSFSAKGSPLAQTELAQLERIASKFSNQELAVFWISTNSSKPNNSSYATNEDLRAFTAQFTHINVLRTTEETTYKQLGVDTLPTILVIDQSGKLVGKPHIGVDPQANLASKLTPLVNNLLIR